MCRYGHGDAFSAGMSPAEINIAAVQRATSIAAPHAKDTAPDASSGSSFATVLQAAQHTSGRPEVQAPVAIPGTQAQFVPCSAVTSQRTISAPSTAVHLPVLMQDTLDSDKKPSITQASEAGPNQTEPHSAEQLVTEPSTSTGITPKPIASDASATQTTAETTAAETAAEPVAKPSSVVLPTAAQGKNGMNATQSKSVVPALLEADAQEPTLAKDARIPPAQNPQDVAHIREKSRSAKAESSAVATSSAVAAPTAQPVIAEAVPSQGLPQAVATNAHVAEASPQGKGVKAAMAATSPQASSSPAQPVSLPAAKQQDATLNSVAVPLSAQSARPSLQDGTHQVSTRGEAHASSVSDPFAQIPAQAAGAPHGEGASFSLSLGAPTEHDGDAATSAPNTGTASHAGTSSDALTPAPSISTPVKRLEVAMQDPVLGNVAVHAEMRGGVLHASLSGSQEAIGASLSSLHHYLQEQQVAVSTLSFNAPAERVNGTGTASGASDSMRGGTGANSSPTSDRGERQERKQFATDISNGETGHTGSSVGDALQRGRATYMPAGSTLSIHI